jgi:hypothetical protein
MKWISSGGGRARQRKYSGALRNLGEVLSCRQPDVRRDSKLPTIPRALVNEYITAAESLAESDAERAAIRMAITLNSPSKHRDRAHNPRYPQLQVEACLDDFSK